jgi:hypothetical protein
MMTLSFDLISDLHIETWPEKFDWQGMPTSTLCVVAGDVAKNRDVLAQSLTNLSNYYQNVIYIDGNEEHKFYYDDIENSQAHLSAILEKNNIIDLKNKVAVIDGVAFIGCNSWWTYDFDVPEHYDYTKQWYIKKTGTSVQVASTIEELALQDATYLSTSVQKLQTHQDVQEIVIVTHTVPFPELIEHDIELAGSHILNCAGNSHIGRVLSYDTEAKISTWCFGHYHGGDIDTVFKGVRFVNNPRGRGTTRWCKPVYFPKKVSL